MKLRFGLMWNKRRKDVWGKVPEWMQTHDDFSESTDATNIFDRLKTEGDLFKPVLGNGIDLEKMLEKIQSLVI